MKIDKRLTTVTPLSKVLALILFFLLPILSFYFGMTYQQTRVVSEEKTLQEDSLPVLPAKNFDTTNWLNYKNDKWNFKLQLPPTWKGYLVSEPPSNPNNLKPDYTADICYYFRRSDSIPACILQISVFTSEQWSAYLQKVGKPIQPLAKSNGYVFISNDYNPKCVQLDEFQCERSKEIPKILSTFTLY